MPQISFNAMIILPKYLSHFSFLCGGLTPIKIVFSPFFLSNWEKLKIRWSIVKQQLGVDLFNSCIYLWFASPTVYGYVHTICLELTSEYERRWILTERGCSNTLVGRYWTPCTMVHTMVYHSCIMVPQTLPWYVAWDIRKYQNTLAGTMAGTTVLQLVPMIDTKTRYQ